MAMHLVAKDFWYAGTWAYAYTMLQMVWWFLVIHASNTDQFVQQRTKDLS
jgi:hypothetical protein